TAKRAGIDPLLKQIYAVFRNTRDGYDAKGNAKWRKQMVIQMGIDGFRAIASKQGDYMPGDEEFAYDSNGMLVSATVYVYKLLPNGQPHKFSKTAYWEEYVQLQENKNTGKREPTQFWKQYPRVMLAKCAEAAALRKGWPHVFGKIYEPGETAVGMDTPPSEAEVLPPEEKKKEIKAALPIPEGIDPRDVEDYLSEVSQEFEKPIEFFRQRALSDPKKFWENFNR